MHLFWSSTMVIDLKSKCYLVFSNISCCSPMESSSAVVECFCSAMRLASAEWVEALLSNLSQTYWYHRNLVSSVPTAPNTSSTTLSFQSLWSLFPFLFYCSPVSCEPPPSELFCLRQPVLLFIWRWTVSLSNSIGKTRFCLLLLYSLCVTICFEVWYLPQNWSGLFLRLVVVVFGKILFTVALEACWLGMDQP